MKHLIGCVAVFCLAAAALAGGPAITIIGDVTDTTLSGNFGSTLPLWSNAARYHYYTFTAAAGTTVTYSAARTSGALDPAIFIFQGNMGGTPLDSSNPFGLSPTWLGFTRIGFADDEHPAALPGPYGDPAGTLVAPVSGVYTLVLLSSLSNTPGPGGLGYTVTVSLPTPGAAALLGFGGLLLNRRRRTA